LRKGFGKILQNVTIDNAGAEGNCIVRDEGRVVFVRNVVPGDVCDIKIIGKKKKFLIGELIQLHSPGPSRIEPFCEHFGVCGGCKWQHMDYSSQLSLKQQHVIDSFQRIGKLDFPAVPSPLADNGTTEYRNKMEYTFSPNKWLEKAEIESEEFIEKPGLGFHIPNRFDKIVHVNKCWLQDFTANNIRNWCYDYALEHEMSFYHPRKQVGLMRNVMLRNTRSGSWMVLLIFKETDIRITPMLTALSAAFPEITSMLYSINGKVNDSIYDLNIEKHAGDDYLVETLNGLDFAIRPKSFFQTNPNQAEVLYKTALEFAGLTGSENVYDLYCGTGTISLFLAQNAKKVVGIESVPQAIEDANDNAVRNKIDNCEFIVGDMKHVFNDDFVRKFGAPDVIITDPPRAGMHQDVVNQICKLGPEKVVYVSCNPASQARDLDWMREFYTIAKIQPVDMFPHTHHVENVVLLERIKN
jgi:23S rRNA (uracil1939-C5)-methyltransferase